jgi:hypothetical protein
MRPIHLRACGLAIGLLALATLLPAGTAMAEATAGNRQAERAAALLDKLHTREVAQAWRTMILTSLPECGGDETTQSRTKTAWQTAIQTAFDVEKFYGDLHVAFTQSFTAGELEQLLAFRNSLLGRKISLLEKPDTEGAPDAAAAMAKIGAASRALQGDPARRKVMEQLVAATGGVDALVDMLSNVSLGTSLGAAATTPAGQPRMTHGEILDMVGAARPVLREAVNPMIVPATAMVYKALTIQELRQYRDMLVSPLGRKASAIFLVALNKAMQAQAFAIGARFAKELNAQDM